MIKLTDASGRLQIFAPDQVAFIDPVENEKFPNTRSVLRFKPRIGDQKERFAFMTQEAEDLYESIFSNKRVTMREEPPMNTNTR